ncbi:C13 family peptidase [Xanthomonas translucens]|uniref:C13 family peptidase n=1 Tax=Xanthomonas campestris pv. translucens TaxID=343 RepID=UPI0006426592|nr:C13 family peptidase [Xanthomonas translucens]AKK67391.1 peptidase C13 [Xanthomonas translucens pv. undulosa]MCT8270942.1 C13 family peptidase [Xanthomonas translucens pv. undulosa]QEN93294.1 peptidase C13 [Xanthomonas translucens pv. undulosa]QEO26148.1 peptidase C13 [Xanthomonas translucens pv. undulosa]QSQ40763.1 peptidase C13 [Xanthomonas translucens pv. translucens]
MPSFLRNSSLPYRRLALALLLALLLPACHADAGAAQAQADAPAPVDPIDQAQLRKALAALQPQRPGTTDLYVVGFAGDASEDVFRNETHYLRQLFAQRFGAAGRIVTLINHADNLGAHAYAPQASYDNLADTLQRIGKLMDRREDALLLFLTSHGTEQHELYVQFGPGEDADYDTITPKELRGLLDDAGIRNRVIVLSACYSGGFVPALKSPDTLIITAARRDRSSFGCGNTASATYFGRAWLIDALARTTDFVESYRLATAEISARERAQGEAPSYPQLYVGARIAPLLQRWRAPLQPVAAPAYPYPEPEAQTQTTTAPATAADGKAGH